MEKDLIVVYVTNKGMDGQDKKAGYYASGYIPANLSARYPGKVLVVDINDERNQGFLHGDYRQDLYAFPVDEKYGIEGFYTYKERSIVLDAHKRQQVRMIIPYVSSEADVQILRTMKGGYPEDVFYTNDPESMAEFNSKDSLIRIRREGGDFLREHIQPQTLIKTEEDFLAYQSAHPNFVLRALRSTEGLGVYMHAPDYHEGRVQVVLDNPKEEQYEIKRLLSQGTLLATPYIDTSLGGDTRAFYYWDTNRDEPVVITQGGKRMAPHISKDNLFPVCNVSSGGQYEVVNLTPKQTEVIRQAGIYYHSLGLNVAGFDLLGIPCDGKIKPILSEGNLSADAWNYVAHQSVAKGQEGPMRGDHLLVEMMSCYYKQAVHQHDASSKAQKRVSARQDMKLKETVLSLG